MAQLRQHNARLTVEMEELMVQKGKQQGVLNEKNQMLLELSQEISNLQHQITGLETRLEGATHALAAVRTIPI